MSKLTRRQLLIFFGASAGTAVLAPLGNKIVGSSSSAAQAITPLAFTPVRLPHPLPIYQQLPSFLATGNGEGNILNGSQDTRLTKYTVLDDVIVPPEYERYLIVSWGDRLFSNTEEYVGYNNDYTGFVPLDTNRLRGRERNNSVATGSSYESIDVNDGYLWINHEYVSYPITFLAPETPKDLAQFPESFPVVVGYNPPNTKDRTLLGEFLYNMGGSIIRIRKDRKSVV